MMEKYQREMYKENKEVDNNIDLWTTFKKWTELTLAWPTVK